MFADEKTSMNSHFRPTASSVRSSLWVLLACWAACGCSQDGAPNPDPVEFTVKVTSGGKPVSGLNLALQPTGPGLPSGVPLQDGTGQGKAIAGSYAYFVTIVPSKDPATKSGADPVAALNAIPEKYHQAHLDHQLKVSRGATIELRLD